MSKPANPSVIRAILIVIAIGAIGVPALVVRNAPVVKPHHRVVRLPRRVVPAAELPPVEPVKFVDLPAADARKYNASVPFSDGPNPAARPFRFSGTDGDLALATDCLAAAVVYEAGDDATGEQAVAQVIVNRLRHPAFPKTVCGVVFEGSERSTGCQFTFTCDGALTRWTPSEAAWKRAREVAAAALSGSVYKLVGYSTHYHTEDVVPYWQSSLDKVAAVRTHLFFRWTGWWGTPPAFNRQLQPGEPAEAKMAALSDEHRLGAAMVDATDTRALAAALLAGASAPGDVAATGSPLDTPPAAAAGDPDTFLVLLDALRPADSYKLLALQSCGDRPHCIFMGWTDPRQVATRRPLTDAQVAAMSFSYMRERSIGFDRTLWNCDTIQRSDPQQCMKRGLARTAAPAAPPRVTAAAPVPVATPSPATPLAGVRRRLSATPSPAAMPQQTSPAPRP